MRDIWGTQVAEDRLYDSILKEIVERRYHVSVLDTELIEQIALSAGARTVA